MRARLFLKRLGGQKHVGTDINGNQYFVSKGFTARTDEPYRRIVEHPRSTFPDPKTIPIQWEMWYACIYVCVCVCVFCFCCCCYDLCKGCEHFCLFLSVIGYVSQDQRLPQLQ